MKNKIKFFILGSILIGFFVYGVFISNREKYEIDNNGEIDQAVITKVYHLRKRGYYVNYEYTIEGEKYSGSQEFFKGDDPKVGQLYKVRYSSKKPNFSRLLFDELIKD